MKLIHVRDYRCVACRLVQQMQHQGAVPDIRLLRCSLCGHELELVPFDAQKWTEALAVKMGGAAAHCACGNWFVMRPGDPQRCAACVLGLRS